MDSPEPQDDAAAGDELAAAALAYAHDGLHVFPLKPRSKLPATIDGFKSATTDSEQIRAWWTRWPDANIGVRTGAQSGVVVLDVDAQHGGAKTLAELERRHGKLPRPHSLTGGGGNHYLFAHPGVEVRNSAGTLGHGLDVRGDGGYIVVPPSVHANGRHYKQLRPFAELEPAPSWLLEDPDKRRNGTDAAVTDVIPSGRRNAELASIAGTMRRRGLGSSEILAALREVNAQRCKPPLDEDELAQVAESVSRYQPAEQVGKPAYNGPRRELEETVAVFARWLHLPDLEPVYATLGATAANYLPGQPVWLVLVAPPASGKTELLASLSRLPDVYPAATLTEASLLSGSPKRDHAHGAKGGLLRELGEFGVIVLKDLGSVLSMRPDSKAETLAALREVFDGSWTRYVGTDGGRTLHWEGKVGLIAGATPVLDRHHAVIAALGERFTLCRLGESTAKQAHSALTHVGKREAEMRHELSEAVAALFAGERPEPRPLDETERVWLVDLAELVTRARSAVERDRYTREIELIVGAEGPARLALTLERLLAGLDTLGCDRNQALGIARRVALDCIPPLRLQLLKHLTSLTAPEATTAIAEALEVPTLTARRGLEELTVYQLTKRYSQGKGKPDLWRVNDWVKERLP